jgi:cobalt-zinc-cadmium efflux system outer membrane protein
MSPFPTYVLGIAVAVLGALPALGQPTTLSLDDLLAEVEAANPTLRAARLDAAALSTRSDQVALPDPTVAVTAFPYPILTARGAQRSQWRIEQMIPWPGTLAARRASADAAAEVAAAEADVLAANLALQVTQAYVALYRVQEVETLVEQFRDRLDAYAEAAAVRYEVGRGPQGAILKAQVERGRLEERLLALAAQRRTALETLSRLTDRPELRLDSVALAPPPLPEADAGLVALALRTRPEVEALDAAEAEAEAQIALARRAFYPNLGLNATYFDIADRAMPSTADGRDALALGVMVKVPLWRGALRARLEEVQLREAQIEARRDALETEFATEIADLVFAAQQERTTLDLYRDRLIPQAETAVESLLSAYTTGQADFLALLDAERTLFALRTEAEASAARLLTTTAALERAVGLPLAEAARLLDTETTDE